MDLISCRNLLIYLEPSLQKKAIPTFHYALKPQGFLFLGASESTGGYTDLFELVDKKHKIYSKKAASTQALHLPVKKDRSEQPSPALRAAHTDRERTGRAAGRSPRRSQRPARGRPRHSQSIRSARRAYQCPIANPAIPRADQRLPSAAHGQGELRRA